MEMQNATSFSLCHNSNQVSQSMVGYKPGSMKHEAIWTQSSFWYTFALYCTHMGATGDYSHRIDLLLYGRSGVNIDRPEIVK